MNYGRSRSYNHAGLATPLPASVSGNYAAFNCAVRMWRTWLAAWRSFGATWQRLGNTMKTGLHRSAATMRIGVTRSVSFDITAAASNRPFQALLRRWAARLTSEPFSSIAWNSATSASGSGVVAFRRFLLRAPRRG